MTNRRARVLSVNVALPVDIPEVRSAEKTSIDKRPVSGDVEVDAGGLAGDEVGDKRFHGGPDKAVYAFAREDLDLWSHRLGRRLPSGSMFGENLTTTGIDVNAALLGERWRVGSVLLEVRSVRIPCRVFQNWLALAGYPVEGWTKRFSAEARPGAYLGVLEPGVLRAGDEITVAERPEHGVSVSTLFRSLTTQRSLLPELLELGVLPVEHRKRAQAYVDRMRRAEPAA